MMSDPRFEIRPRQRGRDGLLALDVRNPPLMRDVMIDRLDITVRGSFGASVSEDGAGDLFDRYKHLMLQRSSFTDANWGAPASQSRTKCRVSIRGNPNSTIQNGAISVEWARNEVNFSIRLTLNPTRTLRHRLSEIQASDYAMAELQSLPPERFFAASNLLQPLLTLDGNDNALPDLNLVRSSLGDDYPTTFMHIYDGQLRKWAIDAVAPIQLGFIARETEAGIEAVAENDRVHLRWPHLTIRSAEAYFERRHSNSVQLLDRLTRQIPAGHSGANWRRYGQNETGGRRPGSEVVGLDLTQSVQQKYYAKTRTRVRAETTYTRAVRNALRVTSNSTSLFVVSELSAAIRRDTILRCRWNDFCAICAEPPRATLAETTQLLTAIVQAAISAKVDPEPVLAALLSTGGIDETDSVGAAPRRLIQRLARFGVIETTDLRRRSRPNSPKRHRLTSSWTDAAERLQQAFAETDE